jgi:hypothetical protein
MSASPAASAAQQPFGQGLTNSVGHVTPTFACVFQAGQGTALFHQAQNGASRKFGKVVSPTRIFLGEGEGETPLAQAMLQEPMF